MGHTNIRMNFGLVDGEHVMSMTGSEVEACRAEKRSTYVFWAAQLEMIFLMAYGGLVNGLGVTEMVDIFTSIKMEGSAGVVSSLFPIERELWSLVLSIQDVATNGGREVTAEQYLPVQKYLEERMPFTPDTIPSRLFDGENSYDIGLIQEVPSDIIIPDVETVRRLTKHKDGSKDSNVPLANTGILMPDDAQYRAYLPPALRSRTLLSENSNGSSIEAIRSDILNGNDRNDHTVKSELEVKKRLINLAGRNGSNGSDCAMLTHQDVIESAGLELNRMSSDEILLVAERINRFRLSTIEKYRLYKKFAEELNQRSKTWSVVMPGPLLDQQDDPLLYNPQAKDLDLEVEKFLKKKIFKEAFTVEIAFLAFALENIMQHVPRGFALVAVEEVEKGWQRLTVIDNGKGFLTRRGKRISIRKAIRDGKSFGKKWGHHVRRGWGLAFAAGFYVPVVLIKNPYHWVLTEPYHPFGSKKNPKAKILKEGEYAPDIGTVLVGYSCSEKNRTSRKIKDSMIENALSFANQESRVYAKREALSKEITRVPGRGVVPARSAVDTSSVAVEQGKDGILQLFINTARKAQKDGNLLGLLFDLLERLLRAVIWLLKRLAHLLKYLVHTESAQDMAEQVKEAAEQIIEEGHRQVKVFKEANEQAVAPQSKAKTDQRNGAVFYTGSNLAADFEISMFNAKITSADEMAYKIAISIDPANLVREEGGMKVYRIPDVPGLETVEIHVTGDAKNAQYEILEINGTPVNGEIGQLGENIKIIQGAGQKVRYLSKEDEKKREDAHIRTQFHMGHYQKVVLMKALQGEGGTVKAAQPAGRVTKGEILLSKVDAGLRVLINLLDYGKLSRKEFRPGTAKIKEKGLVRIIRSARKVVQYILRELSFREVRRIDKTTAVPQKKAVWKESQRVTKTGQAAVATAKEEEAPASGVRVSLRRLMNLLEHLFGPLLKRFRALDKFVNQLSQRIKEFLANRRGKMKVVPKEEVIKEIQKEEKVTEVSASAIESKAKAAVFYTHSGLAANFEIAMFEADYPSMDEMVRKIVDTIRAGKNSINLGEERAYFFEEEGLKDYAMLTSREQELTGMELLEVYAQPQGHVIATLEGKVMIVFAAEVFGRSQGGVQDAQQLKADRNLSKKMIMIEPLQGEGGTAQAAQPVGAVTKGEILLSKVDAGRHALLDLLDRRAISHRTFEQRIIPVKERAAVRLIRFTKESVQYVLRELSYRPVQQIEKRTVVPQQKRTLISLTKERIRPYLDGLINFVVNIMRRFFSHIARIEQALREIMQRTDDFLALILMVEEAEESKEPAEEEAEQVLVEEEEVSQETEEDSSVNLIEAGEEAPVSRSAVFYTHSGLAANFEIAMFEAGYPSMDEMVWLIAHVIRSEQMPLIIKDEIILFFEEPELKDYAILTWADKELTGTELLEVYGTPRGEVIANLEDKAMIISSEAVAQRMRYEEIEKQMELAVFTKDDWAVPGGPKRAPAIVARVPLDDDEPDEEPVAPEDLDQSALEGWQPSVVSSRRLVKGQDAQAALPSLVVTRSETLLSAAEAPKEKSAPVGLVEPFSGVGPFGAGRGPGYTYVDDSLYERCDFCAVDFDLFIPRLEERVSPSRRFDLPVFVRKSEYMGQPDPYIPEKFDFVGKKQQVRPLINKPYLITESISLSLTRRDVLFWMIKRRNWLGRDRWIYDSFQGFGRGIYLLRGGEGGIFNSPLLNAYRVEELFL